MSTPSTSIPIPCLTAGTKTNVASSASSVLLLAANAMRGQYKIFNDSQATLCVDETGGTASATSYTFQIAPGGYYESKVPHYIGDVTGCWLSANGFARVTEFT